MLGDRQRREQRPALEQHAPALAHRGRFGLVDAERVLTEHRDLAGIGRLEADDRAHQHRFSGARASDHPENLAAADIEIEILMDDLFAEAVLQAATADDRFTTVGHQIHPIQVKKRSEEHTSELQSLLSTSYAVICL